MRIGGQHFGRHHSGTWSFLKPLVLILAVLSLSLLLACTDQASEQSHNAFIPPDTPHESEDTYIHPDVGSFQEDVSLEEELEDALQAPYDIQIGSTDIEESVDDVIVGPDTTTDKPTLYPSERILSPITPFVRAQWLAIASIDWDLEADIFMKVGASSTVSSMNLTCFSGDHVELGPFAELEETISFFNAGDASGETPFERDTLSAKVGKTAKWAVTGSPSPLQEEIEAISPLFSLVHYGANDMQMGTTYQSAIWSFGEHLLNLTDELIDQGIIPILSTISPRLDIDGAHLWVPTYCAVIRGIAQGRQIPLLDLHYAVKELPGYGLSGDGLHFNAYKEDGAYRPCNFSEEGLLYGYNMRNLVQCQALKAVKESVLDGVEALEVATTMQGDGSPSSPFVIPSLPFSDIRSTDNSPYSLLDEYVGCDATQDESGPEYLYQLDLEGPTHLRALVFDRGDVDIDLHLLDESASEEGCIERDHKIIEMTLAPGRYHFSLDTYVSGNGSALSGEYLFVLLACEPGDPECADG